VSIVFSFAVPTYSVSAVARSCPVVLEYPRPASAPFELRFAPGPLAPGAPGGGPGVTVTASGTIISTLPDAPLDLPVPDSRVIFGAGAGLTGGVSGGGAIASGRTIGLLSFATSTGTSIVCNPGGASWSVSAAR